MPASASSSAPSSARHLVIITGLSGSGKGSVLKTFEDQGYYAIDNLPVSLLSTFSQLLLQSAEIERAALVIDVREGSGLTRLPTLLGQLRQKSLRVTVLFLEATEASLVRRFSETRRPHPLGVAGVGVRAGIQAEMKTLARIRRQADLVVDTSQFTVHELREYITAKVIRAEGERAIRIALVSSGKNSECSAQPQGLARCGFVNGAGSWGWAESAHRRPGRRRRARHDGSQS